MAHESDFQHIGKRMPFTVPDGYLQGLQQSIISATPAKAKKKNWFTAQWTRWASAAAAVALLIGIGFALKPQAQDPVSMDDIEGYFAQLSDQDQQSILDYYSDDLFLSQIDDEQ